MKIDNNIEAKLNKVMQKSFEELKKLVINNCKTATADEMEKGISIKLMDMGKVALKESIQQKNNDCKKHKNIIVDDEVFIRARHLHNKNYLSTFGTIEIARYCYQPENKPLNYDGSDNIYPVDDAMNLPNDKYSYNLQEMITLISKNQSYKSTNKLINNIININVPVDSIERIVKNTSEAYDDFYIDNVPVKEVEEKEELLIISYDGKGVPMTKNESKNIKGKLGKGEKKQKKKESLVGVVYNTIPIKRTAISIAASLMLGIKNEDKDKDYFKAKNVRKMASLEKSKDTVIEELKVHSEKLAPLVTPLVKPIIIMDGATTLWTKTNNIFGYDNYIGILDIIHVRDYTYDIGHLFYAEGSEEFRKYSASLLLLILEGNIEELIEEVKKKSVVLNQNNKEKLKKIINYFYNHLEVMKYDEYLKNGYPIASGMVESACSQVVANRMELPGARWTIKGAEAMLKHRSILTSNQCDEYWLYYKNWMKNKNYANNEEYLGKIFDYGQICA